MSADSTSDSRHVGEISLGGTEFQIHVEANRDMIAVIGHIEGGDILVFLILFLHIFQLETAIFVAIIRLDGGLSSIHQTGGIGTVAVHHAETDGVSFLPFRNIKRPRTHEEIQHVVDIVVVSLIILAFSVGSAPMLLDVAPTAVIGVGDLVESVLAALL